MKGLSAFGKNVAPPAGKQLNRYEEGEYIDTAEKTYTNGGTEGGSHRRGTQGVAR